jgi:hypothetical protein
MLNGVMLSVEVYWQQQCGSTSPHRPRVEAGNTEGGIMTVQLTYCLTGLESVV